MAETSDQRPQSLLVVPTDDFPADTDADTREATELAHLDKVILRRNPSHASIARQAKKPLTLTERFTFTSGASKFWRRQISVTVPHDSCRDHLGMFLRYLISNIFNERVGTLDRANTPSHVSHVPQKQ